MDPFNAFLIFVVMVLADILAAQSWLSGYYRFGIPVFTRRVARARPLDLPALEARFKSSQLNPTLRFKALDPRLIAFREVLFENRAGLRYLPIMHAVLRAAPGENTVSLVGYLNWYVLAALAYLVYRSSVESSYIPVGALIVVVLVLSYFGQVSVYHRLVKALAE